MSNLTTIIIKKRMELIKSRGKNCEICGKYINNHSNIQMHHINRNRSNNKDYNLLLLCINCHIKQHPDNPVFMRIRE